MVESSSESLNNDYNFDYGCFESDEDGTRSSEMACSLRQVTCEKMDIGNIESDSEVRIQNREIVKKSGMRVMIPPVLEKCSSYRLTQPFLRLVSLVEGLCYR